MAIIVLRNDQWTRVWKEALEKAGPQIPIYTTKDRVPAEAIRMAAVWKHPPGSLGSYPGLMGIHCLGAGVDFIMEDKSIPSDIPVMRVVDPYLASDMAEYVLAQVMGHLKGLPGYKSAQLRGVWDPSPYKRIDQVTVGIMGLGTLGVAVAERLEVNGFTLVGWTRKSSPEVGFPVFKGMEEQEAFLNRSDILVCLLPLTPETRGILNQDVFEKLPEQAYLINVARGPLLEDTALLAALGNGKLSGACLDVFHTEPLPQEHPFWTHPKVHMTPHVASVSDPGSVAPQIIANYRRLLKGDPLGNEVNRSRGY